ncbi:MAG: hypothetical protein K5696_12885, partial [Lachnospiraceae bacterium]|nr:hypothetical protein [Lachnospiraceae bacterium]
MYEAFCDHGHLWRREIHNEKVGNDIRFFIVERKMTDYELIRKQAEALADGNPWDITLYANISALLYESLTEIN